MTPRNPLSGVTGWMVAQIYAATGAKAAGAKALFTLANRFFASIVVPCFTRKGDLEMPQLYAFSVDSRHPLLYGDL